MQFISILELQKIVGSDKDLSQSKGQEDAIHFLETQLSLDEIRIGENIYDLPEIKTFIRSLDAKKIIFLQWIDQHLSLKEILSGKLPKKGFEDDYKWEKHILYTEFSQFLSPYLQNSYLPFFSEKSLDKKQVLFSYTKLLPKDDKIFVEQELFKNIQEKIVTTKALIEKTDNEKELIVLLQGICNDSMTSIINDLSRSSYATKLWYVDQLLWIIQQKSCTVRLANWILKQLEQIELNPEHATKVSSLKEDLRNGKIKIRNLNLTKRSGFPIKPFIQITSLLLIGSIVFWVIWKKPFSQTDEDNFTTSTSFEQFSKEERKKIDSLLRDIQQSHKIQNDQIDLNNPIFGNGISLQIRNPIKNIRMEKLYSDLLLDADLQEQNLMDTCVEFSVKSARDHFYKDILHTDKSKGTNQIAIKNESGYAVYLIIFENEKNGKVYSKLIQKSTTVELMLTNNDNLLFIAGNSLGKFIPPPGIKELPSKDFDHHFCLTDQNYNESLNNIYKLEYPQKGKNKLLLSGDKNGYFSVVDLYGVLEMR